MNAGAGGRWFTGSSADGYGCDVCHSGGPTADLAVTGLPLDGYVPGTAYEVTLTWPATTPHFALIAELTDEARHGAGTLALPTPEATTPPEACSGDQLGFPASELHDADLGRQLVSVIDCGAQMLRFEWVAPAVPPDSPVWFNVGFVTSDQSGSVGGDGVTMVKRALPLAGEGTPMRDVAESGCSAAARPVRFDRFAFVPLLASALLAWRRFWPRKGHR